MAAPEKVSDCHASPPGTLARLLGSHAARIQWSSASSKGTSTEFDDASFSVAMEVSSRARHAPRPREGTMAAALRAGIAASQVEVSRQLVGSGLYGKASFMALRWAVRELRAASVATLAE